jgi:hypothetical protein
VFQPLEAQGRQVERIYVSVHEYADMRKWGWEMVDKNTNRTLLRTGLQCTVWGAAVFTRKDGRLLPQGVVLIEDDHKELHRFCLRCKTLFTEPECQTDICVVANVQES